MLFVRFCNGNLSRGILEIVSLLRATPSCTGRQNGGIECEEYHVHCTQYTKRIGTCSSL
jgi:hypothetical protein